MGLVVLNVERKPDEFCKPCGLWKKCRTAIMNGEGAEDPIWLFCGEAPGKEEDREGFPFVGESGQELRQGIQDVGIPIEKCRFSNAVRCRPPDNKLSAYPDAIEHCRPHILREIRATNPKVVVLLGNSAIQSILNKRGILKLHGEVIDAGRIKYVCCFHPAYLLRNDDSNTRRKFLDALKTAKRLGEGKSQRRHHVRKHHIIRDRKMLQEFTDRYKKAGLVASDIEGSTLSAFSRVRKLEVGCVGFSDDPNEGACFPVHGRVGMEDYIKVKPKEVLEAVQEIWECPDVKLFGHFFKYDYVYMAVLHDIWAGGKKARHGYYADTGLMSYALNEKAGGHGLKDWAYKIGMPDYDLPKRQWCRENPANDPERGGNLIYMPAKILYSYNTDDCIADYRLFFKLRKRIKKQKLWELPFKFPIMWHNWTAAMQEIAGLNLDLKRNIELSGIYDDRIAKLDKELMEFNEVRQMVKHKKRQMFKEAFERVISYKKKVEDPEKKTIEIYQRELEKFEKQGESVLNINAPEVKRELVFEVLGYDSIAETPSGLDSVRKEFLEELHKKKPNKILGRIIQRSELASAYAKYIKPVPDWAGTDGRTHTVYKPQGTMTGRVSSENPNHENLPKRMKLAMELRTQFVSRKRDEYGILEADEKQMELRLISDRAQDEVMIGEFNAGKDPHRMGAAAAYEIREEEVTKEQRNDCKNAVSFGLVYGREAPALAADFGWSIKRAQQFKDRYFGKYHGIWDYLQDRRDYILKHGIVYSHFFRPRRLPEVDSEREGSRNAAVREGINSPIQGDCSDVTWLAGHRLQKALFKYRMRSRHIVTVHDALYVDYYYKELNNVMELTYKYMTDRKFIEKMTGWWCTVPWDIDISLGPSLGTMKELEHKKSPGDFVVPSEFS